MTRSITLSRSLAHQVMQQLRAEIIHGKLTPGERLVELAPRGVWGRVRGRCARRYRCPNAAAWSNGARTASFVAPLSFDDMYELFKIRSPVERYAVRRAIQWITDADCDALDALIAEMRDAGQHSDMITLVECDLGFHRRLCEWSGSTTIVQMWTPLYSQIQHFVA